MDGDHGILSGRMTLPSRQKGASEGVEAGRDSLNWCVRSSGNSGEGRPAGGGITEEAGKLLLSGWSGGPGWLFPFRVKGWDGWFGQLSQVPTVAVLLLLPLSVPPKYGDEPQALDGGRVSGHNSRDPLYFQSQEAFFRATSVSVTQFPSFVTCVCARDQSLPKTSFCLLVSQDSAPRIQP